VGFYFFIPTMKMRTNFSQGCKQKNIYFNEGQKGRGKREEREIKYFLLFVGIVCIILMSFM